MNKGCYIKNVKQIRTTPDILANKWVKILVEHYITNVDIKVRLIVYRLTKWPIKRSIKAKI